MEGGTEMDKQVVNLSYDETNSVLSDVHLEVMEQIENEYPEIKTGEKYNKLIRYLFDLNVDPEEDDKEIRTLNRHAQAVYIWKHVHLFADKLRILPDHLFLDLSTKPRKQTRKIMEQVFDDEYSWYKFENPESLELNALFYATTSLITHRYDPRPEGNGILFQPDEAYKLFMEKMFEYDEALHRRNQENDDKKPQQLQKHKVAYFVTLMDIDDSFEMPIATQTVAFFTTLEGAEELLGKSINAFDGSTYPYAVIEEVDANRVTPPSAIVAWFQWKDYKNAYTRMEKMPQTILKNIALN